MAILANVTRYSGRTHEFARMVHSVLSFSASSSSRAEQKAEQLDPSRGNEDESVDSRFDGHKSRTPQLTLYHSTTVARPCAGKEARLALNDRRARYRFDLANRAFSIAPVSSVRQMLSSAEHRHRVSGCESRINPIGYYPASHGKHRDLS